VKLICHDPIPLNLIYKQVLNLFRLEMCTKKRKTNAPVKNVQNVQHLDENVGWQWCEILYLHSYELF
jgi:hypothetical protein